MRLGLKSRFGLSLLASVCLLAFMATVQAADTTGGSVTGTVTKDGAVVANAHVMVFKGADLLAAMKNRKQHGDGGPTSRPSEAGGADAKDRPTPVAKGETGTDGTFTLTGIPAGKYVVVAIEPGQGRGHQPVTIADGQQASVTLTLEVRPAGAGGRAGGPKKDK